MEGINIKTMNTIRDMCLNEYNENEIRAIILYGSAAKTYVGKSTDFRDYDINIFLRSSSLVPSTYGMPKIIDYYQGKKVEVMRNKLPEGIDILEFMDKQKSKRWRRIRAEPIVKIYPGKVDVISE